MPAVTPFVPPTSPKRSTLSHLLGTLDEAQHALNTLDAAYAGRAPISFLSPEARKALGNRITALSSNLPRLAVTALAERLRVQGFRVSGAPSPILSAAWRRNDMDQLTPVLHREALALGTAYVIVWADDDEKARATVESAREVAVVRDPATRLVTKAVKRWTTSNGETHALVFTPEDVTHWRANRITQGANVQGFEVVRTTPNPLGVVPVVAFENGDRLLDGGVSEMADLLPLNDALTKLLSDLLVGSEYYARPRRWATGIELVEDADGIVRSPFDDADQRMMTAEDPAARFGSLPGSDLASYDKAVSIILSQIMAVSALPAHYVGVTTANPASADANRSAEASLTARAEARQATFGPRHEEVARLLLAIDSGGAPSDYDVSVIWNDPATRSVAQEADAVTKLFAVGLLPQSYALARLGYSEDQVIEIRAAARADAIDRAVLTLPAAPPAPSGEAQ